jgi:phosphotransferase system enzyme I (PtsI)
MYPLITTVAEIDKANACLDEAKEELLKAGHNFDGNIETGIMIETPASVMIADLLAEKADFFSIGTNDLIQYTMAIDRVNEDVAYLYQPLAPAMLRMLKRSIESAKEGGIEISVCGKMAGDPAYAMLLMGLGDVHSLSMDVHSIPRIKQFIRSISVSDAAQIAKEILTKRSSRSAHLYMSEKMTDFLEEGAGSELVRNVD